MREIGETSAGQGDGLGSGAPWFLLELLRSKRAEPQNQGKAPAFCLWLRALALRTRGGQVRARKQTKPLVREPEEKTEPCETRGDAVT